MNKKATIDEIINWDVSNWAQVLPFWETQLKNYSPATTKCLEIGARYGGLSLWLAEKNYAVTCSDVHYDLSEAKELHHKYDAAHNVDYKSIDILNWNEENTYDVVIVKSVLGALNDEEKIAKAIQAIYKSMKKDGILLFAENLQASVFHQFFRNKFTHWGKSWYYFTDKSTIELFKPFTHIAYKQTGFLGVFGAKIGLSKLFSVLDKYCFNHITPKTWRYIVYGYAKKK